MRVTVVSSAWFMIVAAGIRVMYVIRYRRAAVVRLRYFGMRFIWRISSGSIHDAIEMA